MRRSVDPEDDDVLEEEVHTLSEPEAEAPKAVEAVVFETTIERVAAEPTPVTEAKPTAPPPVHLSAGSEPPFPLAEPGEYYIGLWSGLPNYGCPYCSYATLEGSGPVEIHILTKIDQGHKRHLKALELKEN